MSILAGIANPDAAATTAAAGVWINLTGNDSAATGALKVSSLDVAGTLGTPTLSAGSPNGVWYSPGAAFTSLGVGQTATDRFSYTVTNPAGNTATAQVTVTITGVNAAPGAAGDTSATVAATPVSIKVTANDRDPNMGDVLAVTALGLVGTKGVATLSPSDPTSVIYSPGQAFDYLSAGETATDSFTYKISDGHGGTSTATVRVSVGGVEKPPAAAPDAAATDSQHGVWLGLTGNDTDPNRDDALKVSAVNLAGTTGTATLSAASPSGVWYTPNGAFNYLGVGQTATDTLGYTLSDGHGGTSVATATITVTGVNLPPVAVAQTAATQSEQGVWMNLAGAGRDPNRPDVLSVTALNLGNTKGAVSITGRGYVGVWYQPGHAFDYLSAGETAKDSFGYTVSDGHGGTSTATATVTVTGVNLAPVANPNSASTDSQHGLWLSLLANDTDPNRHDVLGIASLGLAGTKGTVSFAAGAPGGVWYSPGTAFNYLSAGETAADTFGYTISDGHGATSTALATVTVTGVNLAPTARADAATADAQDSTWVDLTGNDFDPNQHDALAVTTVDTTGTLGTVTFAPGTPTGATYAPGHAFDYLSAGETATDRFKYTISDGHGGTSTATATVTVTGVNQAPSAAPFVAATDAVHGLWLNLLGSVGDVNRHDTDTITGVTVDGTTGSVSFDPTQGSGVFYTPSAQYQSLAPGQSATDRFTYTVSDNQGGTSTGTATVTINAVGAYTVPGRAFYVATNGKDSWSGRLAAPNAAGTDGPFATLGAAQKAMRADLTTQTTEIEGGTYVLNAPLQLLARDSGQTWTAYNGQAVTLDGTKLAQSINLYQADNVTLSGLTLLGAANGDTVIQVSDSSYDTITGNTFLGGNTGIEIGGGGSHVQVLGNQLNNLGGNGISILAGSDYVTVDGNHLSNIGMASAGSGIWFSGSSHDMISNNTLQNIGKAGIGGGSVVGLSDASYNDIITHNTIDRADLVYPDAGGINILNYQQTPTGDEITFNTVTNTSLGNAGAWIGPGIYLDDFSSGILVRGNLLQNNVDGVWVHMGVGNTIDGNVVTGSAIALAMSGEENITTVPLHPSTGNVFENNTAYLDDPGAIAVRLGDEATRYAVTGTSWINNVYGGPTIGAKPISIDVNHATTANTFAQWVGMGNDTTSPAPSAGLTLSQALARLTTS